MATNNYVKFLKGSLAGYNGITTKDPNSIYITTDEGGIYLGDKRLGDIVVKASQAELPAASTVSTSALYYIADVNVLARSNGTNWVQINAAGLRDVTVIGNGDYITGVSVDTNASGTERVLKVTTGTLADNATIKGMEERLADAEETLAALSGGDTSIATMIENAVAPVRQAAAAADSKAQGAVDVNAQQAQTLSSHETSIGNNANAIAKEAEDRAAAITALKNTEIKAAADAAAAADTKAQDAVDVNAQQAQTLTAHETSIGNNATAIAKEVEDRAAAITSLKNNEIKDAADAAAAADAKAQGAVDKNATQDGQISALDGRVAANEAAIETLNGDDTVEGSVDYKVAQEVAKILNDNDASDIDTLQEIADWIKNDTVGVGALNSRITTLESTVNNSHETRIGELEEAVEANEGAIADEVSAREAAISAIKGGAADTVTLNSLASDISGVNTALNQHKTDYTALEGRVATNEGNISDNADAIAQEVEDREAAITGLIGTAADYKTLGALETAVKANATAISTHAGQYTALEGRVAANEGSITAHDGRITANANAIAAEESARATAITNLIDGATTYNTLGKVETQLGTINQTLTQHDNRIGDVESALTWGSF